MLESIYLYFPPSSQLLYLCFCPEVTSTPTRPVDNVVIATKGLQDRNTNVIAGTTVENKGKLILYIFSSTLSPIFAIKQHQTKISVPFHHNHTFLLPEARLRC